MPFLVIPADTHKQGFTIPVVASLDYEYRLLRDGGVPAGWIIEFSDPVIGIIITIERNTRMFC